MPPTTEVRTSAAKGRAVHAVTRIPRGSHVLVEVSAATAAMPNACVWCLQLFSSTQTAKRCSACKRTQYCSRECAVRDWATHHKHECRLLRDVSLKTDHGDMDLNRFRQLLRLCLCLSSGDPNLTHAIHNLAIAYPNPSTSALFAVFLIVASRLKESAPPPPHPLSAAFEDTDFTYKLFCKLACNSFATLDRLSFEQTGLAVFPHSISPINHSCWPNCTALFKSSSSTGNCTVDIVALRDISAEEELTISYMDGGLQPPVRRAKLMETYGFECNCELCRRQSALTGIFRCVETLGCRGTYFFTETAKDQCTNCGKLPSEKMTAKLKTIELLVAGTVTDSDVPARLISLYSEVFPSETVPMLVVPLWQLIYNKQLAAHNNATALATCIQLIINMETLYPPYSPILGLQYLAAARLSMAVAEAKGEIAAAKEGIIKATQACEVLGVILGGEHEMVSEARLLRAEFLAMEPMLMNR
ncbi:SET and MYND domain-containing protein 3 [Entophlyctis sp. JEL0112]|nr:SET and MYND domain-containing protein 3 [Entophlyctis sp. JEL0112]